MSVVYNSSSAEVSFKPPVYGSECVDHYVVSAVSEESCLLQDNSLEQRFTMSDFLGLKTPTFKVKDLEMKPDPAKRVLTSKEAVKEAAQKQQDKEDKERTKKIREQKN